MTRIRKMICKTGLPNRVFTDALKIMFVVMSIVIFTQGYSQKKMTVQEYIDRFKATSIEEMKRSGIPASIIMAQGLVESDNGNSQLALKANNHFGIKCHKDWSGATMYVDDDAPNECFRKYISAWESFRDHSNFIMNTSRYEDLFKLEPTDYKGWAFGLKKDGYATHPQYAEMLIKIIEDNDLQNLDIGVDIEKKPEKIKNHPGNKGKKQSNDDFSVNINKRKVYTRNRIDYIIAKDGDKFKSLSAEMDLLSWELEKYNELSGDSVLKPGQILYLQPKRNRADIGCDFHITKAGESMYAISQLYGIRLKKLYKKNRMEMTQQPEPGQKIWLRKRKPIP